MIREDYVMRMIRQFAEMLAKLARKRIEGDPERALKDAAELYELLGVPRELCEVLDTPTIAGMLREPEKMRAMAELSWEEARGYEATRDPVAAFRRFRRALELFLEARALDPHEEDDASILELSLVVQVGHLDPRYRSADRAGS